MKTQLSICAVCHEQLNLSRREVLSIAVAVKQAAKGRYFVPDDEVHEIVHRLHSRNLVDAKK